MPQRTALSHAFGALAAALVGIGEFVVKAHEMGNDPAPLQARMPLMIGGSGEKRTLRIVARDADIWNGEGDADTYARKSAILDQHCAEVGRDPASIRRR